jgi:hypothetical protein
MHRSERTTQLLGPLRQAAGMTWALQVAVAAAAHGTRVVKQGRGPGSLEAEETAGLDYRVLVTDQVRARLPWLWAIYTDPAVVNLVTVCVGEPVRTLDDESAINVNLLDGQGARYELHTDTLPYTLLLFVTTHARGTGGLLTLQVGPDEVEYHRPIAGHAVIFDGQAVPHTVTPLRTAGVRVSVPMVYLPTRLGGAERAAVNSYLYGGSPEHR